MGEALFCVWEGCMGPENMIGCGQNRRDLRWKIHATRPGWKHPGCILRRFVPEDAPALWELLRDREVNRFLPWFPVETLAEAEKFLRSGSGHLPPPKRAGGMRSVCGRAGTAGGLCEHRPRRGARSGLRTGKGLLAPGTDDRSGPGGGGTGAQGRGTAPFSRRPMMSSIPAAAA